MWINHTFLDSSPRFSQVFPELSSNTFPCLLNNLIFFRLSESTLVVSSILTSNTTELDSEVKLVPVHKDDFKKINEFAEAAWICRDPENSDNIKEKRRNLLREVLKQLYLCYSNDFSFIFSTMLRSSNLLRDHQMKWGRNKKLLL